MDLDCAESYASFANTISRAEPEKWELLSAVSNIHLRVHRGGVMQVSEFMIPDTRNAYVDYCPDIKPGMFGKLVPGRERDLAFVPLQRPRPRESALFSYQSDIWLRDRDEVSYEVTRDNPRMYDLLSLNMQVDNIYSLAGKLGCLRKKILLVAYTESG